MYPFLYVQITQLQILIKKVILFGIGFKFHRLFSYNYIVANSNLFHVLTVVYANAIGAM